MSDLRDLTTKVVKFRDDRDWKQFHTPKDLAMSLVLESAELMEHFQWKTLDEQEEHVRVHKDEIAEEVADVLNYLILISHDLGIDLYQASIDKLAKNNAKYDVRKAKGNHKKYTEL